MINNEAVLAIIPARGGSKGVSKKNIRILNGKPLIAWTIKAALASKYIDKVIISTDSLEIAKISQQYEAEVPFIRDASLAQDDTPTIDVVLDAIEKCPLYQRIILLQPTSPLRSTQDIDAALAFCVHNNAQSCASVSLMQHSPYWAYAIDKNCLRPLFAPTPAQRRQDLPSAYMLNGAIYIADVSWLKQTKSFIAKNTLAYIMPAERSIDIDSELDLKYCEYSFTQQDSEKNIY